MKGYTTRQVAEVLGLSTRRILSWTRSGLLVPERDAKGAYLFSFQDIVLLRTARELLDADVPPRKVKAALEALREQLPVGRPLSAVHISTLGDRILVRDEETVWEPDSGQLTIDFSVAEVAARAEPVVREAMAEPDPDRDGMSADDWYDTAIDLEAVAPDEAEAAYRRALDVEPDHPDAHLNLGRLLHERGLLDEAEEHYRAAIAADPNGARSRFNLGVVLEDRGRDAEAIDEYRAALAKDEGLATAHFNLSRLLEKRGDEAEALGHLMAYKRLLAKNEPRA